jgi:hypothetical protein
MHACHEAEGERNSKWGVAKQKGLGFNAMKQVTYPLPFCNSAPSPFPYGKSKFLQTSNS